MAERAETAGQAMITDAQRAASATVELTVAATKAATEETGKIIDSASKTVSVEMARSVKGGVEAVERELERLLGGERAPVIESIKGIVSKAMADAQMAWQSTLTTTLSEVAKTLDVSNEASPLRALERRLFEQQRISHNEIAGRLERVQEMVGTTIGAAQTAAAVAVIEAHSPGKGLPFEAAIGAAAEVVAAGMGASYTATANSVGALKGSKKGDGIFEVSLAEPGDRCARVVIECTTGGARNWADYLDQAERNRQAQASLGVVARRDLVPGGEMLAVLAPNRIVMAYDPASDEPALFRSALLLLSVQAQRQLTDGRTGDLGAVDTKLAEAKRSLLVMQELMKTAMSVRTGASKVVTGLESLHATLTLCLEQAQGALRNLSRQAA
ncbi:MAG TPA: hypothetical protein VHV57_12250 [Acidimicrobiales bacterium]|nr:hypothetical protein [Acidimicrobiales bacterium]